MVVHGRQGGSDNSNKKDHDSYHGAPVPWPRMDTP
jgi:hypothetical protein